MDTRQTSNGEINRELTTLKRAFSLAIQAGKLITKPHIPLLREDNANRFLRARTICSCVAHLPTHLRPVITFAYVTGWRIPSEVLTLEWRPLIDFAAEPRLIPDKTKNPKTPRGGDAPPPPAPPPRPSGPDEVEAPPGFEPGVEVLQTSALPLGDGASINTNGGPPMTRPTFRGEKRLERETGFEPATSTLARSHSTTELFPPEPPKYHTAGLAFKHGHGAAPNGAAKRRPTRWRPRNGRHAAPSRPLPATSG